MVMALGLSYCSAPIAPAQAAIDSAVTATIKLMCFIASSMGCLPATASTGRACRVFTQCSPAGIVRHERRGFGRSVLKSTKRNNIWLARPSRPSSQGDHGLGEVRFGPLALPTLMVLSG
jgi:hypothetical protein